MNVNSEKLSTVAGFIIGANFLLSSSALAHHHQHYNYVDNYRVNGNHTGLRVYQSHDVFGQTEGGTHRIIRQNLNHIQPGQTVHFKTNYNDGTYLQMYRDHDNRVNVDWSPQRSCPNRTCFWGGRGHH